MPNLTLSIDEHLLKAGRKYASEHHTSLNRLLRELLAKTVLQEDQAWLEETFALMDRAGADSEGQRWTRQDLYDV